MLAHRCTCLNASEGPTMHASNVAPMLEQIMALEVVFEPAQPGLRITVHHTRGGHSHVLSQCITCLLYIHMAAGAYLAVLFLAGTASAHNAHNGHDAHETTTSTTTTPTFLPGALGWPVTGVCPFAECRTQVCRAHAERMHCRNSACRQCHACFIA